VTRLQLSRVSVHFGQAQIVRDVSLDVPGGEWLGLVGPNGAGKTTILSAIAGAVDHAGSVIIGERDAATMSSRDRARHIALVPQRPALPAGMSAAEYVLLGRRPHIRYLDTETKRDRRIAAESMERLGITHLASRPLGALSGGEQQRVVLSRALAQQARVLLLDEGTTALDIGAQQEVLELVDDLRSSEGMTVLSAMHDLTFAAPSGRLRATR